MRATLLALVVLLVAGCLGAPSPPATATSGFYGVAMLGPTCPVQRDPPDPACADKPYNGTLALTTSDGARTVTTFQPDAQGAFNVSVAPGTYDVQRADAGASSLPRCAAERPIVVTQGAWTLANVSCDTGIR